ncbi:hypothetical protein KCP78_24445 [Salmonella enterica subsp. enterica]|nr:hypothetical protein KCP78_24445 [Salmonella enterica subsp. enterica]
MSRRTGDKTAHQRCTRITGDNLVICVRRSSDQHPILSPPCGAVRPPPAPRSTNRLRPPTRNRAPHPAHPASRDAQQNRPTPCAVTGAAINPHPPQRFYKTPAGGFARPRTPQNSLPARPSSPANAKQPARLLCRNQSSAPIHRGV